RYAVSFSLLLICSFGLSSFGREAPEKMGQGFAHIHRLEFAWMDEVVLEPRELGGIEGLHQPVDGAAYPRDTAAAGMVGEPDIERSAKCDDDGRGAAE